MEESKKSLYDETTEAKADVVLKAIGKHLIEENVEEFDAIMKESKNFEVPLSAHKKAWQVVVDCEKSVKREKRRKFQKRLLRACVILLAVVGISAVVFEDHVEAFKYRFKDFVVEKHPEYIDLFAGDNEGGQSEISIENLWYPTYIPEGFSLIDKVERSNEVVFIFENSKEESIQFCQSDAAGAGIGLNNEGDMQGERFIQKKYKGYWTSTGGNTALIWVQGDQLMEIYSDIALDEIFKVADSVSFQKEK